MNWIFIAAISYLLLAIVNLTDKFMVDNVVKSSRLYIFLVCTLGSLIILLAPWLLVWPGINVFLLNILAGILFVVAQYFLYESLRSGTASKSIILIGGSIPVFTFLFSFAFLGESFSLVQIVGGVFLLAGIFLVAFLPSERHFWEKILAKFRTNDDVANNFRYIFLAAFFYAVFFTLTKYIYSLQSFWSAFIWVRIGSLFLVLALLLIPKFRKDILSIFKRNRKKTKHQNKKTSIIFVLNQGLGSLSFVLQNYAIFLGSVAIVNALQGIQYGALLLLGLLFAPILPRSMRENFSFRILAQKILAIILISLGFYFII
ncbi:MAG: DMT family transporter [Candidatus Falkowbacteria bacterium]|nr:DMT family transporter [Candidatus Falkowbacteria bacterium]